MAAFLLIFVLFLELLDVRVPNLPLGDFSSEVVSDGRACGCSSLLDGRVDGLHFSVFIVKLVFHCLFYGFHIFARAWLFLLCLSLDLLKFGFPHILNFLLNFVFIRTSMNVVSFKTQVHDELVHSIISLVFSVEVIIHYTVGLSLGIGNNQSSCNCEI